MRTLILSMLALGAFSINAQRQPLTVEQLSQQADQICSGRISSVTMKLECINQACTNYRINSVAELTTTACLQNGSALIRGKFFTTVYTEGNDSPLPYGNDPEPRIGQTGTMYLRDGKIIYPNGWVLSQ